MYLSHSGVWSISALTRALMMNGATALNQLHFQQLHRRHFVQQQAPRIAAAQIDLLQLHGFSNPNARTVRWIELFALKPGNGVAMDESAGRELAFAFASSKAEGQTYRGGSPVSPPGVVAEPMKKLRPSFSFTD